MSTESEAILLTVPQAARRLQVHPMTLRTRLWAGELECVRIGRAVRIVPAALDAYVSSLPTAGRLPNKKSRSPPPMDTAEKNAVLPAKEAPPTPPPRALARGEISIQQEQAGKQGRPISQLSDAELQAAGQEARTALRHYHPDPLDLYYPPGSPERERQDRAALLRHYRALIDGERAQALVVLSLLAERGEIDPRAEAALAYMNRGAWGQDHRLVRAYEALWQDWLLAPRLKNTLEALLEFYGLFGQLLSAAEGGPA